MSSEARDLPNDPNDRLYEAIASFERALDAGQTPEPAEWLARYADVGQDLKKFFADQAHLRGLAAPLVANVTQPDEWPELPDYQIEEEIGQGGVGLVYRAQDVDFQRDLALKTLRPEHRGKPDYSRRFL